MGGLLKLKQVSTVGAAVGDVVAATAGGGGTWAPSPPAGSTGAQGSYTNPPGAVAVRDAVYVSGPGEVRPADNDDSSKQPVVGFVVQVIDATHCRVQYDGEVNGFVGLTPNATYYLDSTPGQITSSVPTSPPLPSGSIVQRLGTAKDATFLVVEVDRDFEVL